MCNKLICVLLKKRKKMNWKWNKANGINKRKKIIKRVGWAFGYWAMDCVGWWLSKERERKKKGKGRRKWQRWKSLGGLWRNPSHWNFGWPFGRSNDVSFGSNFEEVFYSTRWTILQWSIMILTIEFLDMW